MVLGEFQSDPFVGGIGIPRPTLNPRPFRHIDMASKQALRLSGLRRSGSGVVERRQAGRGACGRRSGPYSGPWRHIGIEREGVGRFLFLPQSSRHGLALLSKCSKRSLLCFASVPRASSGPTAKLARGQTCASAAEYPCRSSIGSLNGCFILYTTYTGLSAKTSLFPSSRPPQSRGCRAAPTLRRRVSRFTRLGSAAPRHCGTARSNLAATGRARSRLGRSGRYSP